MVNVELGDHELVAWVRTVRTNAYRGHKRTTTNDVRQTRRKGETLEGMLSVVPDKQVRVSDLVP